MTKSLVTLRHFHYIVAVIIKVIGILRSFHNILAITYPIIIFQICVPQVVVVGGRQSRPSPSLPPLRTPRLTLLRRPAQETDHILRESQAHQQRDGQTRTRKSNKLYFLPSQLESSSSQSKLSEYHVFLIPSLIF